MRKLRYKHRLPFSSYSLSVSVRRSHRDTLLWAAVPVCLYQTCSFACRHLAPECLLQRSVRAHDWYNRLQSMPFSVSGPSAVHCDHRCVLGDLLCEYAVCRTHKRTMSHSADDLWNARLSTLEQTHKRQSMLEMQSRNFDPSTLHSGNAVTQAPVEASAAMPGLGIQETFPCKLSPP